MIVEDGERIRGCRITRDLGLSRLGCGCRRGDGVSVLAVYILVWDD
jgi:hypothetical protein